MIYIKLPYIPFEPVGGVRTAFDYVMQLNAMAGKTIAAILADSKYLKSWLPKKYAQVHVFPTTKKLLPTDTLILPEVILNEFQDYPFVKQKILLVLNWKYLPVECNYAMIAQLGITQVLTNSSFSKRKLETQLHVPVTHIPHLIETTLPTPTPFSKRTQHSVLILNRKNTHHIPAVLRYLEGIRHTATIVNNVHPDELEKLYATHQYFINLGYPEGFCRPAAEAMAAGCIVVGFTGGGGSDFMKHNENCFIAEDGNEKQLVQLLNRVIHMPLTQKSRVSKQATLAIKHKYSAQSQQHTLHAIFKKNIGRKIIIAMPKKKLSSSSHVLTTTKKSHEILEYQLFQQKQQFQELTHSKIFALWQKYCTLKHMIKTKIRISKKLSFS